MEPNATYYVKLIAQQFDSLGYINYVFENLEYNNIDNHYIMCVRFPNWDQIPININDVGYLNIKYVEAGIDKWYNGTDFVPYKYTNVIFIKFIHEKNNIDKDNIIID